MRIPEPFVAVMFAVLVIVLVAFAPALEKLRLRPVPPDMVPLFVTFVVYVPATALPIYY